jgi:hypothetical protein
MSPARRLARVFLAHRASREVVRSIYMREEGAVEIEGFAFARQSSFIRPLASYNSRPGARQLYSRLFFAPQLRAIAFLSLAFPI